MRPSLLSALIALVVVLGAAGYWIGCSSDPPVEATNDASPSERMTAAPSSGSMTFDDMLAEVAKRAPGFGGVYIAEDGALEIVMTDPMRAPAAESALRSLIPLENLNYSGIRVREGKYAFDQLKGWNDAVTTNILAIDGVVFTDIDEKGNRLRVGISNAAARSSVEQLFRSASVPTEAFTIETAEPANDVLRNRRRPLVGGLQIQFGGSLCTIGAIGNRAGLRGFLTCSHCTNVQGGVEGTVYHQAVTVGNNNRVALETADPLWFRGGVCPVGRCCRYADVSFARVPHPSGPATASSLGRIARTALGSFAWNGVDLFTILGKQIPAFMGEAITKEGRTTGRTTGRIIGTCLNVNGTSNAKCTDNVMRLKHVRCQAQGNFPIGPGDSGSGVFRFVNGNNVAFLGIAWSSGSHFGTIDRIDAELGFITLN